MEKGAVVEFSVKGNPRLAVVEGPEGKNSLRVIDTFGNNLTVAARDIEFSTSAWKLGEKAWVPASGLGDWVAASETARADVDLPTVWELLAADGALSQGLEDLAACLWDTLDGPRCYALFRALRDDRLYFKEKGGRYEVLPSAQVEERRKQESARQNKEKLQEELVQRLRARFADPRAPLGPEEAKRLEALKKYALWGEEAPDKNTALDLLKLLGRPQTEFSAFATLVEAAIWSKHENLDVLRAGLEADFSAELLDHARRLVESSPASSTAQSLEHLPSVTIDDETTTEVDDALAVESLADGRTKYWVHIADPGRWILPGDELDVEARRRGTTVYLPTGRFTMFPPLLAEGPFSLTKGTTTPALSFGCVLGEHGELESFEVKSSRIRVARRLSYAQVSELLLQGDAVLGALAEGARRRDQWRRAQGAVMIRLPEAEVKVDLAKDEVSVGVYAAEASRDLVAEFMILAGEAAAKYCQQNQIPTLYRQQKASEAGNLELLPEGWARDFATMISMSRSVTSPEPGPHAGLGLPSYVQATSPIRRYGDLVVHRQLKAAARGEAVPYSADDLLAIAAELDPLGYQASKLERNADRYWTTEYLARQKGKTWKAVIVGWFRDDETQAQVIVQDLGFRGLVKLTRKHPLGDALTLKVVAADARKDVLTFAEV